MIQVNGYAKINLFLDIESKREDGYHNIISVMQSIDWHDELTLSKSSDNKIHLSCTDNTIPTDKGNTAYKAASLFLKHIKKAYGVNIVIKKNIPVAAGLAGGSADAAAVLIGLNRLFEEPIPKDSLLQLGREIGADVPFCMTGGTCLTRGIGDIMEPFPAMSDCYFVCAKMGEGVSTPQAYQTLDEIFNNFNPYTPNREKMLTLSRAIRARNFELLSQGTYNIFEQAIEKSHPSVLLLKKLLSEAGARVAMMSGSGPSVFGIFESREIAELACRELCGLGANARVCVPIQ